MLSVSVMQAGVTCTSFSNYTAWKWQSYIRQLHYVTLYYTSRGSLPSTSFHCYSGPSDIVEHRFYDDATTVVVAFIHPSIHQSCHHCGDYDTWTLSGPWCNRHCGNYTLSLTFLRVFSFWTKRSSWANSQGGHYALQTPQKWGPWDHLHGRTG